MSLGSTPDTIMYDVIFLLALLPLCFVLLGIGRLLQWLLGIQSGLGRFLMIIFPLVAAIVGTSLYLDQAGVVAAAQVIKKTETVRFREEGDWRHAYRVQVTYIAPDGTTPAASFTTTAPVYDALHEGGAAKVRTISINGWFNLARLAQESTWTWLPWRWLGIGVAVVLLGWLSWQFLNNKVGYFLLAVLALVLFVTPFVFKFIDWQSSTNLSLTPLRATGTITQVERVTEVDPLPGDSGSSDEWETAIETAQPYDIVVVRYTPAGYADPVLGVDAIDVGSQVVTPTMTVPIAYASADPRQVRLLQGTRTHHWKNPVEWLKQQAFAVAFVLIFLWGLGWLGKRLQRFLRTPRPTL
ncbi:MAG: hypothetical protein KF832_16945 [Caldilineaceae bacterium]|nr:hypothetical protein [Caldilineaceae bacterium]